MAVIRGLIISLVIHVLLSWLLLQMPESSPVLSSQKPNTVEVEIRNQPSKEDLQVVRETSIPEAQKSLDDALARFLSAKKQRVVLETKAKESGMTRNRTQNNFETPKKYTQAGKDFSGYKPVDFSKALREKDKGLSTVGEALPTDLAVGSFTALNTDQYQFYSFYARIEELIRFRWETNVRSALELFDRRNLLQRVGERNWTTQAVFILNRQGKLQKILMMKESGITSFDQAATSAFQEVMLFPNPPDEMVEADGLIRLKYSFNVHFDPKTMATR